MDFQSISNLSLHLTPQDLSYCANFHLLHPQFKLNYMNSMCLLLHDIYADVALGIATHHQAKTLITTFLYSAPQLFLEHLDLLLHSAYVVAIICNQSSERAQRFNTLKCFHILQERYPYQTIKILENRMLQIKPPYFHSNPQHLLLAIGSQMGLSQKHIKQVERLLRLARVQGELLPYQGMDMLSGAIIACNSLKEDKKLKGIQNKFIRNCPNPNPQRIGNVLIKCYHQILGDS